MWEGGVTCPKLHALINLGLSCVGLSYSYDPHLFLNYPHFSFFSARNKFCFLAFDRIVGYCKTESLGTSLQV